MTMLHGTRRALLGGGLKPFNFNPRLCTFTPSMSKRAGTVFAGAPIIQGDWDGSGTPDVLSFGRGTQMSGHWYDNFDAYQGGGFCSWTPELSSADSTTAIAYIWNAGPNLGYFRYQYSNNSYRLRIGGQSFDVAATITAGTVEYLSWGWDTNNDLDGTNYAYISRANAQTYGITVQPTAAAPTATIYVGSIGTASPANGIIEGLTLVREIPWNGNFGTDMGQGDIVAAHAAGNDVALSIASWGETFSLPTNATPGALVTGNGEAHSHPHRTNLLGVGAFMMDGTYTNDGWADEGTPTGVAALAAAEKIGPGGYKVTSDAANEGIYKDITLSAGDDVVIRASGYSDGTSVPKVILWDQIGGAEIGSIGSDVLDRVTNGDFAAGGDWTLGTGWSIAAGVASCSGAQTSDTYLYQVFADQANGGVVAGMTYNTSFTVSNYVAGGVRIMVGNAGSGTLRTANGTYTQKITCAGTPNIYIYANSAFDADLDDVIITRTATRAHPDVFLFTGEAPAGCTTIRVKLVNTDATAAHITYWNEAPVYDNLIDNPSLEGVYAGAENIPIGWTNDGLDVGDAQESSTGGAIIHSGSEAMQWNVGADSEWITDQIAATVGSFIAAGFWHYGDGASDIAFSPGRHGTVYFQYTATAAPYLVEGDTAAAWNHAGAVWRVALVDPHAILYARSGASAARYTDDIYAIALDAVSVTAVPANLANSTEGGAVRVDGDDELSQPAERCNASKGHIRARVTNRHDAADAVKFNAESNIMTLHEDANNYIQCYWSAANTITLTFNAAGGGAQTDTWDATGAWDAAAVKLAEWKWNGSLMELRVGGVQRIAISAACAFATAFTQPVDWGTDENQANQGDMTFSSP